MTENRKSDPQTIYIPANQREPVQPSRRSATQRPAARRTADPRLATPHAPAPHTADMPTEVWVPVPRQAATPRHATTGGRGWMLWLGLSLALFACMLISFLGLGLFFYNSDLILPGVRVMGINVGGLNQTEAEAALQARWQEQQIRLEGGGATWNYGPNELGMSLDAAATAESAYRLGRSPEALAGALFNGRGLEVLPIWRYDAGVAQATLNTLAPQLALQPVSAGIRVTNGQVEVTPPAEGRELDVAATLATIQQSPAQILQDGRLPLAVRVLPPAVADVSAAAEKASQLITTAITVHAHDPIRNETLTWSVTPETWSQWLSLSVDPANPSELNWQMDQVATGAYFTAQEANLGDDRTVDEEAITAALVNAITTRQPDIRTRIYHAPRQHTVQFGETLSSIGRDYGIPYPWIEQANPDIGQLSEGQVIMIPSPDELIPLPVVENKRIVVSIPEQRMWAYESGVLVWDWPVSTGIDDSPTHPGVFQIQSHVANAYAANWDLWMPHFLGIYRPVPTSEFMNGFHGFPTRGSSQLLWTGDLGRRVTYGCILVSSENAVQLYNWAEEGVIVEVKGA